MRGFCNALLIGFQLADGSLVQGSRRAFKWGCKKPLSLRSGESRLGHEWLTGASLSSEGRVLRRR